MSFLCPSTPSNFVHLPHCPLPNSESPRFGSASTASRFSGLRTPDFRSRDPIPIPTPVNEPCRLHTAFVPLPETRTLRVPLSFRRVVANRANIRNH